jgi:hypothetical protein
LSSGLSCSVDTGQLFVFLAELFALYTSLKKSDKAINFYTVMVIWFYFWWKFEQRVIVLAATPGRQGPLG